MDEGRLVSGNWTKGRNGHSEGASSGIDRPDRCDRLEDARQALDAVVDAHADVAGVAVPATRPARPIKKLSDALAKLRRCSTRCMRRAVTRRFRLGGC